MYCRAVPNSEPQRPVAEPRGGLATAIIDDDGGRSGLQRRLHEIGRQAHAAAVDAGRSNFGLEARRDGGRIDADARLGENPQDVAVNLLFLLFGEQREARARIEQGHRYCLGR